MLRHLEQLGGNVLRPHTLVRCRASDREIEAQIEAAGVAKTIKARWLIGCDGMHSLVREQSGIAFTGAAYEQNFVLADVRMSWPLSRDEVTLFYSPKGLVVTAPLPHDRFRVVATVDSAPERPSIDFMQSVLDARGPWANPGRFTRWCGARGFTFITASRKRRAGAMFCSAATARTFTARPAGKA